MINPVRLQLTCLLIISLLVVPAAAADEAVTVRLGVPPWQGAEVKSAVVAEILATLGYEVEIISASTGLVFQALARGELDLNLSAWVPGQDEAFGSFVESGAIVVLGENLTGAETGLAVPAAVYENGLRSMDDLAEFAQALESTIYCIEPGSGANTVAGAAVEADLYGLGHWQVLPSSTEGMLSHVGRAIRRGEPTVFCAWAPHWMNITYDIHYLADPLAHWGGPGATRVLSLARAGLEADQPDLAAFIGRFQIDADTQSDWIHAYARDKQPLETIARTWLADNHERVIPWLEGLRTPAGEDAVKAFAEQLPGAYLD